MSRYPEDVSIEEEEVALSLVDLREGKIPEITPGGRPIRSKRKRFDSDDYVFEDDLLAKQEVSIAGTCSGLLLSHHAS